MCKDLEALERMVYSSNCRQMSMAAQGETWKVLLKALYEDPVEGDMPGESERSS